MRSDPRESAGVDSLTVTVAGLCLLSCLGALSVWWAAGQVLDAAADHNAYVAIIGPGDEMVSDNAQLEQQVNGARAALGQARQLSLALAFGSVAILGGLVWRLVVGVGSQPKPAPAGQGRAKNAPSSVMIKAASRGSRSRQRA